MESKKKPRCEEADEETLLRLIAKRENNLKRCKEKVLYYSAQIECETSELNKLKGKLEAVQSRKQVTQSVPNSLLRKRKLESSSMTTVSSSMESESSSDIKEMKSDPIEKPQLLVPAMLVPKSKPKLEENCETSHQLGKGRQQIS